MEEECRQKDEVIRDKESVIDGKNEALWRLDEIIRKNELVMSEKEEELKEKDTIIRAQQIEIQRLTNQPAMNEMVSWHYLVLTFSFCVHPPSVWYM